MLNNEELVISLPLFLLIFRDLLKFLSTFGINILNFDVRFRISITKASVYSLTFGKVVAQMSSFYSISSLFT